MAASHESEAEDDLRPEYDPSELRGRVRGKYYQRYLAQTAGSAGDPFELTGGLPPQGHGSPWGTTGSAEAQAFIRRMDEEMRPLLAASVLPIYAERDGVPVACGTGTLFRIADVSFLVTASHVA